MAPPTAVSWFAYLLIGGLAGWLASRIVKVPGQGILLNVLVGVAGGFLGGMLLGWLGFPVDDYRRLFTFVLSLGGAVLLLGIVKLIRGR
ncbi:GlsB/YeaQ/YmgE family stress response membrane protein [Mycobacterium sp. DSM 3803]|nr:GlsB/YeaQ/YmgE family stress response membrane protein [Mycobacterium sp. DSM 3803]